MNKEARLDELIARYPQDARIYRDVTPKPSGDDRELAKPNQSLKLWLKEVNKQLALMYPDWPQYIHGRKYRSYLSYAKPHTNKQLVITIDIKACFPTVTAEMISSALRKHLKLSESTAIALASRVSFHGSLAQGFPTSNIVCNLVLLDALDKINTYTIEQEIVFNNYVDDIAFSGSIKNPDALINKACVELSHIGMSIKKAKVKVMPSNIAQVICGLVVNKKLSISKEKKKQLISGILSGALNEQSIKGWISYAKSIDAKFSKKLEITLQIKKDGQKN